MLIQGSAQGTMGMYRKGFLRKVALRSKMTIEVNVAKIGTKDSLGRGIQLYIQKPEDNRA